MFSWDVSLEPRRPSFPVLHGGRRGTEARGHRLLQSPNGSQVDGVGSAP